jgi:UV damage repair endonuclease
MSLGVVCHAIKVVKTRTGLKEINLFENRTLQLGRFTAGEYSHEKIYDMYVHNASKVLEVLPILADEGVKLYRLSSDLLPLADKIDPAIWDTTHIRGIYKKIGDLCRARKIRVTMHPAQFCVLNSESESVIQNAVRDMQHHAWVLDACEFDESPTYAINIHAGRRDRFAELVQNIEKTSRKCAVTTYIRKLRNCRIGRGIAARFGKDGLSNRIRLTSSHIQARQPDSRCRSRPCHVYVVI